MQSCCFAREVASDGASLQRLHPSAELDRTDARDVDLSVPSYPQGLGVKLGYISYLS